LGSHKVFLPQRIFQSLRGTAGLVRLRARMMRAGMAVPN
jgi:hypothetical protein